MILEELEESINKVKLDIEELENNFSLEDQKALMALYETLQFLQQQRDNVAANNS